MIRFTKMHGIRNDYLYIDAAREQVDDPADLARRMADRHAGVGADGIILIHPPDDGVDADIRMQMFNADGSESEMCGNGVRCVCKYAHDHGLASNNPMRVQTGRGILSLEYELDSEGRVSMVTVDMGEPILEAAAIPVNLSSPDGRQIVDFPLDKYISMQPAEWMDACGLDKRMTCVSMGNPHLVIYCEQVSAVPLETVGPYLERQAIFPNRINVHFVQVEHRGEVKMRTWERGTGITLACGTGASAVCVAGVLAGRTDRQVLAHLPGGDLELNWDEATNHVFKRGPAVEIFSGEWPEPAVMPVA